MKIINACGLLIFIAIMLCAVVIHEINVRSLLQHNETIEEIKRVTGQRDREFSRYGTN